MTSFINSVRISDHHLICANVITIHQTDFNDFIHKLVKRLWISLLSRHLCRRSHISLSSIKTPTNLSSRPFLHCDRKLQNLNFLPICVHEVQKLHLMCCRLFPNSRRYSLSKLSNCQCQIVRKFPYICVQA